MGPIAIDSRPLWVQRPRAGAGDSVLKCGLVTMCVPKGLPRSALEPIALPRRRDVAGYTANGRSWAQRLGAHRRDGVATTSRQLPIPEFAEDPTRSPVDEALHVGLSQAEKATLPLGDEREHRCVWAASTPDPA